MVAQIKGVRRMFATGSKRYLCDSCKWDYGTACVRPEGVCAHCVPTTRRSRDGLAARGDRRRAGRAHRDPGSSRPTPSVSRVGLHRSTRRKWHMIGAGWGPVRARGSVLDVPCGTGRFTELLLGAGKSVVNRSVTRCRSPPAGRTRPAAALSVRRHGCVRGEVLRPHFVVGFSACRRCGRICARWGACRSASSSRRAAQVLPDDARQARARQLAGRPPPSLRSSLARSTPTWPRQGWCS